MINKLISVLICLAITTPSIASASETSAAAIASAVADPTRTEEHRLRDEHRLPAEVMALAGVAPGQKIGEIAAGGGYYTALLSRAVGESGTVYAVDPKLIFEAFPNARQGFQKYISADPRTNVEYSVQRLDEFSVAEPLDTIFMVLYYHDTLWTGEDRKLMNQRFLSALKPGGTLFVLDHDAVRGAGDEIGQTLHRMDKERVAPEVTAAGFELVAEHDLLVNQSDPLDVSVFDEAWRGKTNRFIYVFKKPID